MSSNMNQLSKVARAGSAPPSFTGEKQPTNALRNALVSSQLVTVSHQVRNDFVFKMLADRLTNHPPQSPQASPDKKFRLKLTYNAYEKLSAQQMAGKKRGHAEANDAEANDDEASDDEPKTKRVKRKNGPGYKTIIPPKNTATKPTSLEEFNKPFVLGRIRETNGVKFDQAEKLSLHVPVYGTSKFRRFTSIYTADQINWSSQATITKLNKWQGQIRLRLHYPKLRTTLGPFTVEEREWILNEFMQDPQMSAAKLIGPFNERAANATPPRPMRTVNSLSTELDRNWNIRILRKARKAALANPSSGETIDNTSTIYGSEGQIAMVADVNKTNVMQWMSETLEADAEDED
ncbi:hypothetical protein K402DRAFT_10414 [Aulographum hederae CBS 113979]|uniref:Uncharacterized protein n=1 Tax=Aulographum hederae CBS 113979 TaxID=1176131 RepID=A0A6G1HI49_9PEZI|nr:hypothetical protein K402DRAFT_10414 [Aulographum hederae CBS 113979]